MVNKYLVGLWTLLLIGILPLSYGIEVNNYYNLSIKNITKISYNSTLFLDYDENNNPIFYTQDLKQYYITPITVCTVGINESLLKSMNFKIDNNNYDVLISNNITNTTKKAIFFAPLENSKKISQNFSIIYWEKDPLNYKTSEVIAKYKLPNKGKIIATYSDGSPACIMIGNKIYCGFEPNKEVLYNLLYIFMINKLPHTLLFSTILLLIISGLSISSQNFRNSLRDIIYKFGIFVVIGRLSIKDEEKILLNDTRREIYNCIIDNPGIHLRELAKKLNKGVSTITWHLRILEKANLVRSKKIGNKLVYYPKGMDISDLPLLYFNNKTSQEIFKYILHNPSHLRKIAEDLDMPVETVRYNLKKMEKMNIVNKEEDGNKIVYYVNPTYTQNLI